MPCRPVRFIPLLAPKGGVGVYNVTKEEVWYSSQCSMVQFRSSESAIMPCITAAFDLKEPESSLNWLEHSNATQHQILSSVLLTTLQMLILL